MKHFYLLSALFLTSITLINPRGLQAAAVTLPANRAASIYISQDFINDQLKMHSKSELFQQVAIVLDAEKGRIVLRGILQIPTEELRAVNLAPKLGRFQFQLAIKPETTKLGHLILDFPLDETFFYPEGSKNLAHDRVIVPVQMLSLALASARGYLAALSGDFTGFDRRAAKLEALSKALDRSIKIEKNPDALDDLKDQRESLRLQLAAVPFQRKQIQTLSKEVGSVLGFTGEKELSFNSDLAARDNALILKIKLSQLAPFLKGVELGGVRILHDKKDGGGQNYLAIDVNAELPSASVQAIVAKPSERKGVKVAPSIILRLNQSLLESDAVLAAEKKSMGSNLQDFEIQLKDDGLHISGSWHALFLSVPFDTLVDFVSTGTDVFEVRVRKIDLAGIDLEFLTKFVLEALEKRIDQSLKGICTFAYLGEESDKSRALQVTVDSKKLIPAFPDLHLIDVDIREREFLLKIGRP